MAQIISYRTLESGSSLCQGLGEGDAQERARKSELQRSRSLSPSVNSKTIEAANSAR